ncbi:MAG: hypothetical protein RLZZ387_4167 [Chloroflexota bacterium]|jgi:GH43 family beta-xylosidase
MNSYTNPVYPNNFPDPFVLKWCGEYWAYCTGHWRDGRCFGVLRSRDLVRWEEMGGALDPLPGDIPHYWAPEVSYYRGRFYMYYSAGIELEDMAVRVAVADHPAGPFVDQGVRLTAEPFAIDAHVFQDHDGARYLFYATDYLEHSHVGTGTAMVRLDDPLTPAGPSRPVTRARYDWQVYDPNRAEKGGVRWHTVEGPFVLWRKGRYYQMFSGGNWTNPTYGVSFATSDRIDRPDEWEQASDGERVLPILRTIPGKVVGPGHNSAVRGPDNRQLICVYHRWVGEGRAMAIDPLDWAGEHMLVLGPSDEPRPAPTRATLVDFFDEERDGDLGPGWECSGGSWRVARGTAVQSADVDPASARATFAAPCFVAEVSARALAEPSPETLAANGSYGLSLEGEDGTLLYFLAAPGVERAHVLWRDESGWREQHLALPADFAAGGFQQLRAEVDGPRVRLGLGEGPLIWRGRCSEPVRHVALRTSGRAAAFAGFALTVGYEDLFDEQEAPERLGWRAESGAWRVADGELCAQPTDGRALIRKEHELEDYELVVNARSSGEAEGCAYAIYPAARESDAGPALVVERRGGTWEAAWRGAAGEIRSPLPASFDGTAHHQWRIVRHGGSVTVAWEQHAIGVFDILPGPAGIALGAWDNPAFFEMVRVTTL